MILNVSGRTDIVAFYTSWFLDRYQEGYVDVRNPFFPKKVSRIYFKDVEAIIFCTKNPLPILSSIDTIKIPFIFHITLTPYKKDIEPNVIPKGNIIQAIQTLSKKIGSDKIYIRYDPIFLNNKYTISYHIQAFSNLCTLLEGYTHHIIISFIDDYKNVRKNNSILKIKPFTKEDYEQIGKHFSEIAHKHQMEIQTCCEQEKLLEYGFSKRECLDKPLALKLTGRDNFKKWNARKSDYCNCLEMVDIGVYNSCSHFCKYCYANYDEEKVKENRKNHNPKSSLLIGNLEEDDIIQERKK